MVKGCDMSYRINYFQKKREGDTGQLRMVPVAVLLLLLAVINGVCCQDGEMTNLRGKLFPWTQPEVRDACAEMLEHLSEGQPIGECIDTFCDEILHDTETAS